MQRYAFKMFLNPGEAHEYRRRHDASWPEPQALQAIKRQELFDLSRPRHQKLFADPERTDDYRMDELTRHSVMRRWWAYMKDIMAANPDGSPVTTLLVEMFHLE